MHVKEVIVNLQSVRLNLDEDLADALINATMDENQTQRIQDALMRQFEDKGVAVESVEED